MQTGPARGELGPSKRRESQRESDPSRLDASAVCTWWRESCEPSASGRPQRDCARGVSHSLSASWRPDPIRFVCRSPLLASPAFALGGFVAHAADEFVPEWICVGTRDCWLPVAGWRSLERRDTPDRHENQKKKQPASIARTKRSHVGQPRGAASTGEVGGTGRNEAKQRQTRPLFPAHSGSDHCSLSVRCVVCE